MTQFTTAGRLFGLLYKHSEQVGDAVANESGIPLEQAHAAVVGAARLTLAEQLRLSEATAVLAPGFVRQALRLRAQVLAARSYEQGDVMNHQDSPAERWERSALLRR
jgi:hypothetical protein